MSRLGLRAPALRAGDRVAVVSPSSPVIGDRLPKGMATLRAWGYEPVLADNALGRHGHLAGRDRDRVVDLDTAFRDPTVRAIVASRGGFGAARLLDDLDWDALAADPKVLVGFSDVTALLAGAWGRTGLVSIHGQFAGRLHLQPEDRTTWLRRLWSDPEAPGAVPGLRSPGVRTIAPGTAEGPLVGGNLATLCSLLGTVDAPDAEGAILFLEDVNEAPYRIDRMLTQLARAGVLTAAAGIVVGALVGHEVCEDPPSLTADQVLDERLGELGVPVLVGAPIGHTDQQVALPVGVRAHLDADGRTLTLLEGVVRAP